MTSAPDDPAAPLSGTRSDASLPSADGTWVRLGPTDWTLVFATATPVWAVGYLAVQFSFQVARIFDAPWPVSILIGCLVLAAVLALTFAIVRWRVPDVWVDAASHRLRAGKQQIGWEELTTAELLVEPGFSKRRRSVALLLRGPAGFRIPLVLVRRGRPVMKGRDAELAATVVEASAIAMPRAKEDPDGKFSRWNFPTNVSKDDAMAVIVAPPGPEDQLPIPQ